MKKRTIIFLLAMISFSYALFADGVTSIDVVTGHHMHGFLYENTESGIYYIQMLDTGFSITRQTNVPFGTYFSLETTVLQDHYSMYRPENMYSITEFSYITALGKVGAAYQLPLFNNFALGLAVFTQVGAFAWIGDRSEKPASTDGMSLGVGANLSALIPIKQETRLRASIELGFDGIYLSSEGIQYLVVGNSDDLRYTVGVVF